MCFTSYRRKYKMQKKNKKPKKHIVNAMSCSTWKFIRKKPCIEILKWKCVLSLCYCIRILLLPSHSLEKNNEIKLVHDMTNMTSQLCSGKEWLTYVVYDTPMIMPSCWLKTIKTHYYALCLGHVQHFSFFFNKRKWNVVIW